MKIPLGRTLAVTGALALFGLARGAHGYIEALYPLQQFLNESEVIADGVIEKTDTKDRTCIVKINRSLKGKCHYDHVRMNIGVGQEWHPDAVMRHLVVGAPALIFYNGERRGEIYVNRFFMQLYGDAGAPPEKAWWSFTHIEIRCNRTFNGTTQELAKVVGNCLAGKMKCPAADPKLPPITRPDVTALPVWDTEVEPAKLPAPFRKKDAAKPVKPREPENPTLAIKGLAYKYYEGQWSELPDFDALAPAKTGIVDAFDISKRARDDYFGFKFTGFIEVPKDGTYAFTTVSDDGSKLFIGKEEVVSNDGLHPAQEMPGEITLKAGKHAITVTFFEAEREQSLDVLWEGPGIPRQKVPASALFHTVGP